jgi:hypothetical protein
MAGVVVGNMRTHIGEDLKEVKEQLTVLFIGMLFVLLAADVRLAEVRALGLPGLFTLLALMLLVRPINVIVCSFGSDLTWRERAFIAWLSPRGVVAAAIASLFASEVAAFGIAGGNELRALVFLVIAGTVLIQGLTGGAVARMLGVRRPTHLGYVVVGANELGHALGRILRDHGEEVVFVDNNPDACHVVERDGFRVIYGNPLEERTLQRAQVEDRAACVAVTMSDEINFIVGRRATYDYRLRRVYVAISSEATITAKMIREGHAHLMFDAPRDLELWSLRLRRGTARVETRRANPEGALPAQADAARRDAPSGVLLRLAVINRGKMTPVSDDDPPAPQKEDVLHVAVFEERRAEAEAWLQRNGWGPTVT